MIRLTAMILAVLLFAVSSSRAQALPLVQPATVGMNAERLNQIDLLVAEAIAAKKMPGAVVVIGHKGRIVYRKAFGSRALAPEIEKMTVDTIFDLASLTKPIATATSVMILVERGKIRLTDRIGDFMPDIENDEVKKVTVLQLLTHTGGFRPDFDLREKWTGRDGMLEALKKEKLSNPAGTKFVYSDIGFIVLGEIVQRVARLTEDDFVAKEFLDPLKMNSSEFLKIPSVKSKFAASIAPTENIRGQQNYLGSTFEGDEQAGEEILRGRVHDPTAFRMNGVAGHAGLFANADDLARYCQMILSGGVLGGRRILSAQSVAKMTAPYVVSESGDSRGLGWDINTSFSSNRGELFPLGSFGHTGFTGTGIWIDPVSSTFVVFLSNRVHPDGKGDIADIRAKVSTAAASAIEDTPVEKLRQAEVDYYSQIAPQIESFKSRTAKIAGTSQIQKPQFEIVLNGIDVLEKDNFKELDGLKIGLVTNQTGRNLAGKSSIDVLGEAKNVKLVALFSPEHGIRGELDQSAILDSKDEKTGLPIYSLYGETRRPKPDQLQDLDAVVFDIQDIGTRFYTYISTLKNVLEESARAGKAVYVLDRPNPVNGVDIEGPVADSDKLSFVAAHPIPVRHGMTIGELAAMFNAEDKIGADLKIIQIQNWKREMWFDETGQFWVNPSPNMRSLTEATLYPGIGLLETTNLSVGRGTDTPFEVIGAPWIDGRKLANHLNERNLPGVRFVPIRFTPKASVFKGEIVGGVNIIITDRAKFTPIRTGVEIAVALRKLYPNSWEIEKYQNLIVNRAIFDQVKLAGAPETIELAWQKRLRDFQDRRIVFLLYK